MFLVILSVIICSVYLYFKYVFYAYWSKRGLPYVEPTVPIGNLLPTILKQKYLGDIYRDQYHKYNKLGIFGMYTFHKPSLVIADPDLIRFVMTKEFSSFHDRGMYCNPKVDPLSDNLFMLPGAKWKNLRTKLTQTFTSGKMKRMFDVVNTRGIELSNYFERNLNKELDLREVFAKYTTDVIVSTAMGIECNSLADPNSEFRNFGRKVFEPRPLRNACLVFAPGICDFFKIPFTPKSVQAFFLKAFEETVNYRKEHNISSKDFMDLLMQLMNKGEVDNDGEDNDAVPHISSNASGKISILEAAAQAFIFFIAGFETSSSLAAHCIYEMSLNEEIQIKCRQDIEAGLKKHGNKLTYDSLNDMPYLHKVIHEGMRMYPALGGLIRVCTKEIVLPNKFRVEKGVDLVIPVLGLHSDPDIYPQPGKFNPERFTPEEISKRHPYTYLPFGEGPRICIGDIYEEAYHKYKKLGLFGMYTFHKPSLVIADPELIRIVLTKEFSNFHDRGIFCNEEIDPLGAHLFMLPGSKWKNLRIKLTPAFSSGKMKRMFHIIKSHGVELEKLFERSVGKEVELRDVYARYTTDVIVTTAMGVECNCLEDPEHKFRYFGKRIFEEKPLRNACVVFAPKLLEILKIPFTPKKVEEFFFHIFKKTVDYRRKNNIICQDFLDLLIQLINNGNVDKDGDDDEIVPHIAESTKGKISVIEAASQAYVFFIAGFETSATLVAHCLYEMTLNQEIQDKCRSDIKAGLDRHGGEITYDSIKDMPYLHKVLQEGMRKYPAVGGLNRICTKDTVLPSGFRIEKGVDILIPIQGIHRDPDIYPDPDDFNPERFTAENCAQRHPYNYIPFGEGPRNCIGLRFAYMQTKIAVINSLLKFRFVKSAATPGRLKINPASLIAVPDGPIFVRIEKL